MKNLFITGILILITILTIFFMDSCKKTCPVEPVSPSGSGSGSSNSNSNSSTSSTFRTLKLVQDSTNDGDVMIISGYPTSINSKAVNNCAANWTKSGVTSTYRSYIQYDLSAIKSTDSVISAIFYVIPKGIGSGASNDPDITETVSNSIEFCLVKTAWVYTAVSWDNQPTFSTLSTDTKSFAGTLQDTDTIQYDLTNLVQQICGKNKIYTNNGFVVKMANETTAPPYEAMTFFSMNAKSAALLPYLQIQVEGNP